MSKWLDNCGSFDRENPENATTSLLLFRIECYHTVASQTAINNLSSFRRLSLHHNNYCATAVYFCIMRSLLTATTRSRALRSSTRAAAASCSDGGGAAVPTSWSTLCVFRYTHHQVGNPYVLFLTISNHVRLTLTFCVFVFSRFLFLSFLHDNTHTRTHARTHAPTQGYYRPHQDSRIQTQLRRVRVGHGAFAARPRLGTGEEFDIHLLVQSKQVLSNGTTRKLNGLSLGDNQATKLQLQ